MQYDSLGINQKKSKSRSEVGAEAMFLLIDNDEGSLLGAPTASAAERSRYAPHDEPLRLSCRMFMLDLDDSLYRLPTRTFEAMLQAPKKHPLLRFAGSRVRMSDVAVELVERQPIRVVWSTFDILAFDHHGRLDVEAYQRHQAACAELGLVPPLIEPPNSGTVIDAAKRFVAQGGCWVPTPSQLRHIGAAALGKSKCQRI